VSAAAMPVAAGGAPDGAITADQRARTKKAAESFEAMAIGQLLRPMFQTVDVSKGLFGGGAAEQMWQPMLVDEMAKMLARRGGIGIADAVYKEMLRIQEAKTAPEKENAQETK
jgi:Rod binding domain-containing protein